MRTWHYGIIAYCVIGVAFAGRSLSTSEDPGMIVATFPMTMKIVIVSQVEFDKLSPTTPVLALAYPDRTPCEIYLPAGYRISTRYPADKWETYPARFIDPKIAGILAHEMMHCMHGAWHP